MGAGKHRRRNAVITLVGALMLLLISLVWFALAVVPIMYTARALGAENTGLGTVLFAVVMQYLLSMAVKLGVSSPLLAMPINFLIGSGIYTFVLGTSYRQGMIISVVGTVSLLIGALVLGALGSAVAP